MIYLLVGPNGLVEQKVKELISHYHIDNNGISTYSLPEQDLSEALDDINTMSFLTTQKMVIVKNIKVIFNSKKENDVEDNSSKINLLKQYSKCPSDNILILIDSDTKVSPKLEKLISDKDCIIDLNSINLYTMIAQELQNYQISNPAIRRLIEYTSGDYNRILNELDKLRLYELDTKIITEEDVKLLVKKDIDTNIFHLTDYIDRKNKDKVFELYHDLLINNQDEYQIIGLLASNYRLLYRVKLLMKDYSKEEIMRMLNVKEYPVKLAMEKATRYSCDEIGERLVDLSDLDIKIKKGLIDKKLGMELFLAKLVR